MYRSMARGFAHGKMRISIAMTCLPNFLLVVGSNCAGDRVGRRSAVGERDAKAQLLVVCTDNKARRGGWRKCYY